ncbi:autotransporter-associated N-terminal domain-containing protein [Fusobacterium nucleatum]|uniref:autotransporter-associated N-terminal domain-containing protein n=1 Tax=Fusobacterium nucleatum TaxID=851 RepID=UPI00235E22F9|nr:autotransporter-associated N-terminal domain-containing protein [Fusobacterium nucleatum]WDA45130.1 autotransporter-associated N-terminal domain-containing protein [Fusobacterium nucleatum]
MRDNNLNKVEKNLKYLARRYRSIKYSLGLAILFLMMGISAFSGEVNGVPTREEIAASKNSFKSSVESLQSKIKEAKEENEKTLRGLRLELIQLMEQGEQVVKSPWSSWQFGMNYMYSHWGAAYKGRGDKISEAKIFERDTTLARFQYQTSTMSKTKYGTTDLTIVKEEDAEIVVTAGIVPKSVDKKAPSYVPAAPAGILPPFEPKLIVPPKKPEEIIVTEPSTFDPPDLKFVGGGFAQGPEIGMPKNHIIVQNYEKYSTPNGVFKIKAGKDGTSWEGTLRAESTTKPSLSGDLTDGSTDKRLNTFINDLRDHDATVSGDYDMTDLGGANSTKIFLSYNPAAVGGDYGGKKAPNDRKITFNGKLTLHGIATPNNSNVLVGMEHQIWAMKDRTHLQSSSTLLNTGDIILASGNNIVGIMIDVEQMHEKERKSHKTINNGRIIINSNNSIGVDFGQYQYQGVFKVDVTLGNIIVNGKHNYGARMKNIFTNPDPKYDRSRYYDLVKITSGAGKKILVNGEENVGISIGKSLSSAKDSNPIANISGLNIEVNGKKTVGFLRNKDYSNNNTNDMILDENTMGTFSFGNNAENSTLVRSDKYGITLKKNITTDKGKEGNSFAQALGEGKITNEAELKSLGRTKFTGLIAKGKVGSENSTITNKGTIEITGDGSENVGMAALEDGNLVNSGTIRVTGKGTKKVGIYHVGNKAEIKDGSKINISGESTTGIYNTKTMTIDGKVTINAKNGSTGIYSSGGTITSTSVNKLNITVDNSATGIKKGLGVYAENGSNVNLTGANIGVIKGEAGVAAYGAGTQLNLTNSTLKYDGDGYAVYSDGNGKINLTNSNIELRGSSTLMDIDLSLPAGNRPITTTNTNVKVYSNDVVAMNATNLGTANITDLSGIKTKLGVNITAGTEGGKTFNKYKELAIDGGTINFNTAVDKTEGDNTAGGFFFKKILGQRLKLNVNSNVTARLSSAIAEEFYNKQVVGLEANSSIKATDNSDTQVNIAAGKTIDVARTDGTDKGGVGVFVNYGQVNNKGTISVEKDSTANSNAVGVYAVNGSEVTNEGTVDVGGKDSIGLLGLAYRTDTSGKEFGGKAKEGEIEVTNKGVVSLDGEGATGIFIKNNNSTATNATAKGTNDTAGKIKLTGNKSVGMSGEKATLTNTGTIDIKGQESTGMFAKSSSKMINKGTINLIASTSADKPNIGMFTEDENTEIENNKDIIGGNNTYGIFGKTITLGSSGRIKVGDNSVGIFSNGKYASGLLNPTINLAANSIIEVGKNESVGVFTTGENQIIKAEGDMKIGDGSYGFVIRGKGTKLFSNSTNGVTLGNDTVFIYSADTKGDIENKTTLTATGNKNYGIYSAGNVKNLADINFGNGTGNVGIYSIAGGTATNGNNTVKPTIRVSKSDIEKKIYGIGMAAGYTDDKGVTRQTGTIINYGTIKVENDNGIGMYATGSGSKAINRGNIELSGKNTTGMYLDNNAIGENYGTIKTVPNATNDGIKGVVALNGAIIKNYGTIDIKDGTNLTGVYLAKGEYDKSSTGTVTGGIVSRKQADTSKKIPGVDIKAPGDGTATVKRNGKIVTPTPVDTVVPKPKPPKVKVGSTELDLRAAGLGNIPSVARASEIGMYIDTSGVNYTNPINGLEKLKNLKKINLIFGVEATRYTGSKDIKVGQNILSPYNKVISKISVGGGKKFVINSASLTWIATGTQADDDTFNSVYLSKIPYTSFAKEKDTYNFMDGLEQRYGVEGIGTREKELFNKLNNIGKGEPHLLAQAVDEMKGHQYSNVEQRVNATGNILEEEFDYLRSEWQNVSKDSNKIKIFGARGEYKTNTAGVINYKNYAYGVAYVHENEDIKLGKGIGWYTGIVHNRFKFKDIGRSKEEQLQARVGLFKSIPFDENNSLNWTISGDIFVGYNKMHRKYLVVNEIFNAKAKYHIYGIGVKNQLAKSIRLSEDFSLRPYAALDLEYGRVSKIKEKSGEIKLNVKANDYISVKPEVGTELVYRHYYGTKTFRTSIGVAYENELGRVGNAKNKARVANTNADWYNLRGEKEDRRGNVKFDLNVGLDNQMYGVTANTGYDTKGHNVRGGLGLRVIF